MIFASDDRLSTASCNAQAAGHGKTWLHGLTAITPQGGL